MIRKVLEWVFGKGLTSLSADLRGAYEARLRAETDEGKIAAEVQIAQLNFRIQSHQIGGRWITAMQIAFGLPFAIYNAKLVVWDKVLGLGKTDPLSPDLLQIEMLVLGFLFGTAMIKQAIR